MPSEVNLESLSVSLVGRMKGLKMNKLNRMGPMIGILEGQHGMSSGSGPFRAVRLEQYDL